MKQKQYHIAVIGGGASGLLAAIAAKIESGSHCRVVIFERNERVGRKILSTGNGRCNLGNTVIQKENYGGSMVEKAFSIFEQAPKTEAYFRQMGLICRQEEHRLYPYSNHASAVLDVLRLQLETLQIDVICNCQITSIIPVKNQFRLQSDMHSYLAEKVIFSCGGYAAPTLGTDGSAFSMLKALHIHCNTCTPALCFLKTEPERVRALKGIRLFSQATLYRNGKLLKTERGEVQFTEQALSGICIFNLSAYCNPEGNHSVYEVALDLLPDWSLERVQSLLWELYALRCEFPIEELLTGILQKRVCLQILKQCGIFQKHQRLVSSCSISELEQIAACLKEWRFSIIGKGDWKTAQVTCGGISAEEVRSTLESVKYKGLYFTGEALDLHGDCGGYNLNWAWASGWWAGTHAAKEWNQNNDKDQ